MIKYISAFLLIFVMMTSVAKTEIVKESNILTLNNKNQVGGRLGAWINNGDIPPTQIGNLSDQGFEVNTAINNANFYAEVYFAYNIFPSAFIELSLGISNRGSVNVFENNGLDTTIDIGNLLIYPVLLQFKYYPLAFKNNKLQPFLEAGGGVYFGKRDVLITNDYYSQLYGRTGESEADFNYTVSGGFDWLLSPSLALELNVKHMPINFSKPLIAVKDYKGTSVTIGIKYMKPKKK